jgi:hypothetical protein
MAAPFRGGETEGETGWVGERFVLYRGLVLDTEKGKQLVHQEVRPFRGQRRGGGAGGGHGANNGVGRLGQLLCSQRNGQGWVTVS